VPRAVWPGGDHDRRLGARDHSVSSFEAAAAALGYRETGNPFAGLESTRPALRIGLCSSLSWGFLRELIQLVRAQPDAPALSFMEGAPHAVIAAARHGEIDVGFVPGPHDWTRLDHEALWREPVMVLMPDHHALASDNAVAPEALRRETFLVTDDPADREAQLALLERAIGGPPAAVYAAPVDRETVIDLVGLGFGLALTTGSTLGVFHPGVNYRPIAAPVEPVVFHAVWPRSHGDDAALARFLDLARALAARWRA
jgi:DNA-binding transcriptional LysR family regulator